MIVGTQHFIVPRQMVWMVLFVAGGIFLGLFTAEHLVRAPRAASPDHPSRALVRIVI
jgi:hypothetical protein